ncbi:ribonucleoside-diphosphate reductase [Halorarius halobius]|uniref:ribonucleoside-diphosphate reductase n=1 Tax=Halorarius halobius TaxID=2962671 RepID=UPI0020CBA031|nr:ribonucleoside-diphosphate reductase [Halorarius halobius]
MSRYTDDGRSLRLDPEGRAGGYFTHAVYNHWDPYEDIPESMLETDRQRLMDDENATEAEFDALRQTIALFGAGEEAVTEDLAPLSMVLDDINDQMFVSSQIYEEAKHTQFFDRYWREVIDPVAEHHGFEVTAPTDDRYFMPGYAKLFDGTEAAMHRLLEEDTPENRVEAYCHYHLVVESVLAQTGYYGITSSVGEGGPDIRADSARDDFPNLPGLVEGVGHIRSDEGRHVGFGMHKVQQHIAEDGVDPATVQETLQSLMPYVAEIVSDTDDLVDPVALVEYARDKLSRRVEIITDASAEIPDVETLVELDDSPAPADD